MNQCVAHCHGLQLSARACRLISVRTTDALIHVLSTIPKDQPLPIILGHGSNVVLPEFFPGTIIQICLKGVQYQQMTDGCVLVCAAAGELWHDLVTQTLAQGYFGLENLAGIPGSVGAAPVQNIGAYGAEFSDFCVDVTVLERQTLRIKKISAATCQFSYRTSHFKQKWSTKYIVLAVSLRLSLQYYRNINYASLLKYCQMHALDRSDMSAQDVMTAVMSVRATRLPDARQVGTLGSFFVNPRVSHDHLQRLQNLLGDALVFWRLSETEAKLSAGWLLDQAGWRGYRQGHLQVYLPNALVLVTTGLVDRSCFIDLVQRIKTSIWCQYGVVLEIEPVVL